MFISVSQAKARLLNPDNLANRFNIGRDIKSREEKYAKNAESRISESSQETQNCSSEIQESQSIESLSTGVIHRQLKSAGRCGPRLSTEERTGIAIEAAISEFGFDGRKKTQKEIAAEHGITQVAVAKIKNGTGGTVDNSAIEDALEIARNKALDRLMTSLGLITDDKISALNAKDISLFAANMARVVEKTIPDRDRQQNINLVVYAPELRNEKAYETVEI
jgi:predicted transcriptional regulator